MIEEFTKYFLEIRDDVVKEHLFISNLDINYFNEIEINIYNLIIKTKN